MNSNDFKIQLGATNYAELTTILANNLPVQAKVYYYGSRAKKYHRPYSDLDLAIDNDGRPLSLKRLARLNLDLEDSNLPMQVDILDLNTADREFLALIEKDFLELRIN